MGRTLKRNELVAFMKVEGNNGDDYVRMSGFTEFSVNRNPVEYTRKYIDERNERSEVVGYSPSIRYSFDLMSDNHAHDKLFQISAFEKTGEEAKVNIIIVDMSLEETDKAAICRNWTVLPDAEGDDENIYTLSGTLKANGDAVLGIASSKDNWETCSFVIVDGDDV